jgi:hypothetical protein
MNPLADPHTRDLLDALYKLRRGEKLVYVSGTLTTRSEQWLAKMARELYRAGTVTLVQRRLGPPTRDGKIDWHNGIGPGFDYIAIGLQE